MNSLDAFYTQLDTSVDIGARRVWHLVSHERIDAVNISNSITVSVTLPLAL